MKLVVGCGFLGLRAARLWRDAGESVATVTRSEGRAKSLADEGFVPIVANVVEPQSLPDLPAAESVLFAVGFDRSAGRTHRQVYVEGLANVLHALASGQHADRLRRFIYVSTTGVYAASDREEVDEESPCDPSTPGAQAHQQAERILAESPFADRAIVLRMAGLYGHERVPRLDDIRAGRRIAAASDGFVNLIHVDDAAAAVLAAETRGESPRTFNISDGHPANRRAYLEEIARRLQVPPPQFVEPDETTHAATHEAKRPARGSASKRISNRRMLAELLPTLKYPSYREGLAASL
jgi:nucleoside-diphosphate-sugar epimerase